MKKTILAANLILCTASAFAQTEVLKISLANGDMQTVKISDITEMTFETVEADPRDEYTGSFTGTNTVVVGGMFTYTADITYTVTKGADGTVDIDVPAYQLSGTVMGDLSLGAYNVSGLAYDESKNGYYRSYGDDGLSMHLVAVNEGATTIDKDYEFKPGSEVTVELTDTGIRVVNSFKMGAMPFDIVATFEGAR